MLRPLRYDMLDVAQMLKTSVKTLDRRIEKGQLLGTYKDGRKRYISRENLEKYMKKLENY